MSGQSSRVWVFTYQVGGEDQLPSIWNQDLMKFLTYQLEKAPTTGQLHLQGALRMKSPSKMKRVKTAMGLEGVHLEPAKAWDKAKLYANKEETRQAGPWTFGADEGQGARTDILKIATMVAAGKRDREVAKEDPVTYMRMHKGISALRSAVVPPEIRPTLRVALLWGKTGCGKTWAVTKAWEDKDYYSVFDLTHPWFDGYQGEEYVLMDDIGTGCMDINFLKRVLDKYKMTVPVKGTSANFHATTIVLTSNSPPECWFPAAREEDIAAIKRRMTIFHYPTQKEDAHKWLAGQTTWQAQPEAITVTTDDDVVDLERSDRDIWPYD